jgi:hypothetical protein
MPATVHPIEDEFRIDDESGIDDESRPPLPGERGKG